MYREAQSLLSVLGGLYVAFSSLCVAEPVVLRNRHIAVGLDESSGAITAITNLGSGSRYAIEDHVFSIEVGTETVPGTLGTFTPQNCTLKDVCREGNAVTFTYFKDEVAVYLTYRLDEDDAFMLKKIDVTYAGEGRYNLNRFEMLKFAPEPAPVESIPYYGFGKSDQLSQLKDGQENPPSDNSTAYFLRYRKDGLFTALTCDFVAMQKEPETGCYLSGYWPGYLLDSDKRFESEYAIIGVYDRQGFSCESHELTKDLRSFLFPNVDIRLDRGEIAGMHKAVEKFISPGVYYTFVNSWGLHLPRHIEDAESCQAFKDAVDEIVKIPLLEGIHFVHGLCGLSREFYRDGLNMRPVPNEYAEQAFRYAAEKDIGLSMFIGLCNNYPEHFENDVVLAADADLLSMDEGGKRRGKNIAISEQYTDFIFNTVSALKKKYAHLEGLSYDFLYISPDYDTNHGYLPGRASLYPQYRNVRNLNQRMRKAFPELMLRGQVGWRELGPWLAENLSMCHNAADHQANAQRNFLDFHIDSHYANNIRLSNWFSGNCKMHPWHKMNSNSIHNGGVTRAWDYGAWEYCVLSQIACGQVFGALHNLPDGTNGEYLPEPHKAFFNKWITWQKDHQDYYLKGHTLFGEPQPTGVDGNVYSNGKDTVLFLSNPTFRSHSVEVPVNETLFLPSGQSYRIRELYPFERYRIGIDDGVFNYGSSFVLTVPPQTVMVFEVKPDDPGEALLLGVQGEISHDEKRFTIQSLFGETGTEAAFAIRRPNLSQNTAVFYNDQPVAVKQAGKLMLGVVRFSGEAIDPEVSDWRAGMQDGKLNITANLVVPEAARSVLASQDLPIAAGFDNQPFLDESAWAGWFRFIIHLPILPNGRRAEEIRKNAIHQIKKQFDISAKLNGCPIAIHDNIFAHRKAGSPERKRDRWTGFFIDASESIEYGRTNRLELAMTPVSEGHFYGIYMPNLTRQKTDRVIFREPPETIKTTDRLEAQDAVIAAPQISTEGDAISAYIRLTLTGDGQQRLDLEEVRVEQGRLLSMFATGNDARWCGASEKALVLTDKPKSICLDVQGTAKTIIALGDSTNALKLNLGEIIDRWRSLDDPYQPTVDTVAWPSKQAKVRIELAGSYSIKTAVEDR